MKVGIRLDKSGADGRSFVGWAPVKAFASLTQADGAADPVRVTLRNAGSAGGGRLVFDTRRSDGDAGTLDLDLPPDGREIEFWVAGEFEHPSTEYGDAVVEAVAAGTAIGRLEMMVRIRKNAVTLTANERDRFLNAMAALNDAGTGPFQSFRDTHVQETKGEAHGYPGFPPWHRAYLLDLERALQEVDATVALPYWRFDEPAPDLFAPAFLGMPSPDPAAGDIVQYPHGHPLEFWKTDGADPIERRPSYDIAGVPPLTIVYQGKVYPNVITQQMTMDLGTDYADFRTMEIAPHGSAHTSFDGPINSVPTAAKDPLFFMLHANVDRLWAYWQWYFHNTDTAKPATYSLDGPKHRQPDDIGHKLADTMWPWNGITAFPRPGFPPPRGAFPDSPLTSRPGRQPTIEDMIDYRGVHGAESLGFDYDDVPFELAAGGPTP